MLVLSMFGIHDRSLGQDYVGYYAWAIFLVVVPGVIVLLVLRKVRKGVAYRSKQSASSDEPLGTETT